jgi:hypothetical protein
LWHSKQTYIAINSFSHAYEVFVCSVGDCDLSYAFEHYKDGVLKRKFVVDSPKFNDQIVSTDFGEPLAHEIEIWNQKIDDSIRIQMLAESIGIPLNVSADWLRTYCVVRGDET